MELNFEGFYRFVRDELNVDLNAYKEKQLKRRIATVMKSSGALTLEDYSRLIANDEVIRNKFLDYITINVTEFYRNKDIFADFEFILRDYLNHKFKNIKIWSAACSIGAEPYSLAMILDKNNIKTNERIIATDIDDNVLKRARDGVFKDFEIKNLDKKDLDKYFIEKENKYYIIDNIKEMVSFKKHDLVLDKYQKGFHAIICRNVIIYLKNETKDEIYRKFNESLVKGGILFTGATEAIYNPKEFGFKKISTFIYEKI